MTEQRKATREAIRLNELVAYVGLIRTDLNTYNEHIYNKKK